ncbi:enoyl-CoA hydratase/isomerase family protein [Leucobacter weissii]|uniref:Enoyl-CoA hydratase/isomerase family protein n=1 Tax=Leucobacter weissii TaxID=1983706 RepID=A0A939SBK1_9MICO|nr:3-hydroxyacyl-CoA dehydrogenase NAD-binding domain-containing protein [Leucobacter weissii]MBO1901453.1 enoyl-CoA hydratase/isomerase family protein [Leucobacter weissii]
MTTVSTTWSGTIAVLTIDNPPVNMGNITLRRDLREAIAAIDRHEELTGVVIDSAGPHFYAGSDISEFDRPLEEPQLPAVIAAIEGLRVPVVAAITGFALGGGFELALGCDARVGDGSAKVGFPEVTLGMIPGAGGTVRSGRLVGALPAIDLVGSARHVEAEEALELGILDRVVDGELREAAIAHAAGLAEKRRLRDLTPPVFDPTEVDSAIEQISRRARPNVRMAVEMVRRGLEIDASDALLEERRIFNRLRSGDEAANLRYLFFARRAAAGGLRSGAAPIRVKRIGIAGAGTMGAALARAFHSRGFAVTVFDLNREARDRLRADSPELSASAEIRDLADADFVVDAVFEDMRVKQELLHSLEGILRDDAVIASNTSYLDLDEMSSRMRKPERFGGLHFFNPADRNPLVEVIRGGRTDDSTIATLAVISSKLGKVPIPAGVGDGFVANRVYADYRSQAEFLIEDGALPQEVDAAMVELGLPIGPFAVGDMSGLDIAWARRKRLSGIRDPRQRYVRIPDLLCEAGRLGRKTGAGWYAYPEGARRGEPDPVVEAIIDRERSARGILPRALGSAEIQTRILASMLCAAASIVDTGIARRASDIDVALTEGFAFPKWLGGPLRYAASFAERDLLQWLAETYRSCPVTFAIAGPSVEGRMPEEVARVLEQVTAR